MELMTDKLDLSAQNDVPTLPLPFPLPLSDTCQVPSKKWTQSGRDGGYLQSIIYTSYFVQWKDWLNNPFPLCSDAQISVTPVQDS